MLDLSNVGSELKICSKCKVEKPFDSFHNDKGRPGGKFPNCKECHYAYTRERYKNPEVKRKRIAYYKKVSKDKKYREEAKERSKKYYNSLHGRVDTLWRGAKRSAEKKNIPFNISPDFVLEGILKGVCPMTGIEFDMTGFHTTAFGRTRSPFAPSLDRIIPSLGYVEGNVRIVTWHYNAFKGEMTDAECLYLCRKILENAELK